VRQDLNEEPIQGKTVSFWWPLLFFPYVQCTDAAVNLAVLNFLATFFICNWYWMSCSLVAT
jgi:hypothetical protein